MADTPFPVIDQELCTGCHLCVDICPTSALAQIGGKATLAYPRLCTYCTICEDKCPEGAISLPFLIIMPERKPGQARFGPHSREE